MIMEIPFVKKIKQLSSYKYKVYNRDGASILVSIGDIVDTSTIIAKGMVSKMSYRIKVSDFSSNFLKYFTVANGEVVTKGDILLKKRSHVLYSPVDGIIDFSGVKNGAIFIKSLPEETFIKSPLNGRVHQILDGGKILVIETSVVCVPLEFVFGGSIEAPFKFLLSSDDLSIREESINATSSGSIIYVGSIITYEMLRKASAIGVAGIIGLGIEIKNNNNINEFLSNVPISIGVISGFGEIVNNTYSLLKEFDNSSSLISVEDKSILFPDSENVKDVEVQIRNVLVGDRVEVFEPLYWGYGGEVINIKNENAVIVKLDNGTEIVVQFADIIGII